MKLNSFRKIWLVLVLTAAAAAMYAQDITEEEKVLALIEFKNMEDNGEHDYLASLISAVLREDLSHTEGITLVERSRIDSIINEQQLQLSGLTAEDDALKAGRMLGSDYLSGGSFIVIGGEVLLDVTLINVETSKVLSFASRGSTDDLIHIAAEKIARELTGKTRVFRTAESGRPIIKNELLPPGKLKLFSHLIDARIYIDDEFVGYTSGDRTIPVEIELQPGEHTIETDLGNSFGVIKEPEIIFEHWKVPFTVESSGVIILEDGTRHYNSILYELLRLTHDDKEFRNGDREPYQTEESFSFTDREGNPVAGSFTIYITPTEERGLKMQMMLIYNGNREVFDYSCEPGEDEEFEHETGHIKMEVELSCRYPDRLEVSWNLERTDIWQSMFYNN